MTTTPRRPTSAGSTGGAGRATRRPRRTARNETFIQRNRSRLLWLGAAVGFLVLAAIAFLQFTRPAYACANLFDPTPAPSFVPASAAPVASGATPAPSPTTPAPGFVQPDMGHLHVPPGEFVRYTNCPPASGKHYNASGQGPIRTGVYGPDEPTIPQGWIHNLEHGGMVMLYKCPGPACDAAGQQAMQALAAHFPNSPICNFPAGQTSPVFTRFDQMPWPYAALVWDVVLPMETLDENLVLDFYARQAEQYNPEKFCPGASPSPGAPSAVPSGSAGTSVPPASSSSAPSPSSAPASS